VGACGSCTFDNAGCGATEGVATCGAAAYGTAALGRELAAGLFRVDVRLAEAEGLERWLSPVGFADAAAVSHPMASGRQGSGACADAIVLTGGAAIAGELGRDWS
jgi:hypothetical protein